MGDPPDFWLVLRVEDPEFRQSEALGDAIGSILEQTSHHDLICIGALANLLIAYLCHAPPSIRADLTESLLADIRHHVMTWKPP